MLIITTDVYQCHFNFAHGQPTCKALYHRDHSPDGLLNVSEAGEEGATDAAENAVSHDRINQHNKEQTSYGQVQVFICLYCVCLCAWYACMYLYACVYIYHVLCIYTVYIGQSIPLTIITCPVLYWWHIYSMILRSRVWY